VANINNGAYQRNRTDGYNRPGKLGPSTLSAIVRSVASFVAITWSPPH